MESSTIVLLLSCIGLYLVWYYGWRSYHLDNYRNNLFTIRDGLFQMGLNGEIPFDSKTYEQMEMFVNLYLRFGHRLTLLDGFATLFWPKAVKESSKQFDLELGNSTEWMKGIESQEVCNYIIRFEDAVMLETLGFVTSYNLFLLGAKSVVWLIMIFTFKLATTALARMRQIVKEAIGRSVREVITEYNQSPSTLTA